MATLCDDQIRAALASGPQTLPQIATATGLGFDLVLMVVQEMRHEGVVRRSWRWCMAGKRSGRRGRRITGGVWEYELMAAAPGV